MDDGDGSAYVFELIEDAWVETSKVVAPDGAAGDRFGDSVDIDGDSHIGIVGATSGGGVNEGSAYLYDFDALI